MSQEILIIDDSITQAQNLMFMLEKLGYKTSTEQNGVEGIKKAYANVPNLIISEILTGELSGHQVCRLLKDNIYTKHIPILIRTNLKSKLDQFWALKAGADAFCPKDTKLEKIVEKIQELLESENGKVEKNQLLQGDKGLAEEYNLKNRVNRLLDEFLIQSTITNEFRNLYKYVNDEKKLTEKILDLLYTILDFNIAGIFYNDEFRPNEKVVYLSVNSLRDDEKTYKNITEKFFAEIIPLQTTNEEFETSFEVIKKQDIKNTKLKKDVKFESTCVIPIKDPHNALLGAICFYNSAPNSYEKSNDIINIIYNELTILFQLQNLYVKAKTLSITDSLTKLYNRRFFQDTIEREFSRAQRYKQALSVVMIDIDHFKKLNDNYGHQFGDEVLVKVADIVKKGFRKSDCVARYGGEEMVAILAETPMDKALIPCERIRKTIEETQFFSQGKEVHSSISVGIAELTVEIPTSDYLLMKADEALYQAKESGRNQIVLNKESTNHDRQ